MRPFGAGGDTHRWPISAHMRGRRWWHLFFSKSAGALWGHVLFGRTAGLAENVVIGRLYMLETQMQAAKQDGQSKIQ